MFVEIHVIQNFVPSNLNRDDTGTPKDCEFGGYRRARISSQCIKCSIRWHPLFRENVELTFASRSNQHARQIAKLLSEDVQNPRPFREAYDVGRYMFQRMGFKEKKEKLTVMLLLGSDDTTTIAQAAMKHWDLLAPLSNENLLWEKLATKITAFLEDMGDDADMLGRLIANHRASNANPTQLEKWLALAEDDWTPTLAAVRGISEEFRQKLREKFNTEESGAEDEEENEYVPKDAAKLFKSSSNKDVNEKLKALDIRSDSRRDSPDDRGKKDLTKKLNAIFNPLKKLTSKAVDVAMFGRMIAEIKTGEMNVDAACQVAHAISTNRVVMESDYFTAVEELKDLAREQGVEQNAGAGMIGSVEFNSACFYRYASVDIGQLTKNLQADAELTKKTAEAFLKAFVNAIPSGKQNTFAAQQKPSLVFAVVRTGGPMSLANAFVKPVTPRGEDSLVEKSIEVLDDHYGRLIKMYGDGGLKKSAVCQLDGVPLKHLKDEVPSVDALIANTMSAAFPAGGAA